MILKTSRDFELLLNIDLSFIWPSHKKAILGGDVLGNSRSEHAVSGLAEAGDAGGVYRQWTVHPAAEETLVALLEIVAAGKHGHSTPGFYCQVQNAVCEHTASVDRHE